MIKKHISGWSDCLLWLILCFVILLNLIYSLPPNYLYYDIFVNLDIAIRLYGGATPYLDYMEINFPTAPYLHIPPVWLNDITSLDIPSAFWVYMMFLIGMASVLCFYLLDQMVDREKHLIFKFAVPIVILLTTFSTLWEFGQREHMFIVMFMPFLILQWVRWQSHHPISRVLMFGMGFVAGIGLTIKPYFFLLMLGVLPFHWIQHQDWRLWRYADYRGMMAFGVFYVMFAILNWEATHYFLFVMMPETIKNYDSYGKQAIITMDNIFKYRYPFGVTLILFGVGAVLYKRNRTMSYIALSLAVSSLMAFGVVVVQQKGFGNHYIIFNTLYYLGVMFLLAYMPFSKGIRIIGLILAVVFAPMLLRALLLPVPIIKNYEPLLDYSQVGDDVIYISDGLAGSGHLLLSGRNNVGYYLASYPVPFELKAFNNPSDVYKDGVPYLSPKLEEYIDRLEINIVEQQPKLIIIDTFCRFCMTGLSFSQYVLDIGLDKILDTNNYEQVHEGFLLIYRLKTH